MEDATNDQNQENNGAMQITKENAYSNQSGHVASENLMGRVVNNEEEAYKLYYEYAIKTGFSVRRSKVRYIGGKSRNQEMRQREFRCSKAGKYEDDIKEPRCASNPSSTICRNKFETKSDCKAMIRFTIKDGLWVVTHFISEHNHELALPSEVHLLRSSRVCSRFPVRGVELMEDATNDQNQENNGAVQIVEENAYGNQSGHIASENLMGRVVNNEEEAYNLYNEYAIKMGFSVRRSKVRYIGGKSSQEMHQREFRCSKAGKYEDDIKEPRYASNPLSTICRNRFATKSDCKAMIRFTIRDGLWVVTHFISEHNHELALPSEAHLLRSNRVLTKPKANVICSMVNAGISTRDAFAFISREVGGDECAYMYGDAQSLISYFKQQQAKDSMFCYDVQVDHENRLMNFFWRDGKSSIDYEFFGDVVVFDTTYRTNKYNLVCAPFVGMNHHLQNVMFGCAFLLDETIDSFIWLFKSFLNSMGGKAPKTIFTNQDQAMAKAIAVVFPDTCHRLCLWHIYKNAPSHLGGLNSNPGFQKLFKKCLEGCESEVEFQETWEKMLSDFDLKEHMWLKQLYEKYHKWCTAMSNDIFSSAILSSQRSESTDHVLASVENRTTSLTQFIIAFEKIIAGWRSSETEEDFQCQFSTPSLSIKNSGILNHAAKVYTHKIFKLFEDEFKYAIGVIWSEISSHNNVYTFEIKGGKNLGIHHHVQLDMSTMEINCSCKKFESSGLLCCHALKILIVKNFDAIPDKYVLSRWSKDARKRWSEEGSSQVSSDDSETVYCNNMMRYAYDIILKSRKDEATRKLVQDGLRKILIDIEVELAKLNVSLDDEVDNTVGSEQGEDQEILDVDPILNPPHVKPKGVSNARLKGHFEKRKIRAKIATKGGKKANTSKDKVSSSPNMNDQPYHLYGPQYHLASSMQIPYQISPNMYMANQHSVPFPGGTIYYHATRH